MMSLQFARGQNAEKALCTGTLVSQTSCSYTYEARTYLGEPVQRLFHKLHVISIFAICKLHVILTCGETSRLKIVIDY